MDDGCCGRCVLPLGLARHHFQKERCPGLSTATQGCLPRLPLPPTTSRRSAAPDPRPRRTRPAQAERPYPSTATIRRGGSGPTETRGDGGDQWAVCWPPTGGTHLRPSTQAPPLTGRGRGRGRSTLFRESSVRLVGGTVWAIPWPPPPPVPSLHPSLPPRVGWWGSSGGFLSLRFRCGVGGPYCCAAPLGPLFVGVVCDCSDLPIGNSDAVGAWVQDCDT